MEYEEILKLKKSRLKERGKPALLATLNLFPVVGQIIAMVLDQVITDNRWERLIDLMLEFKEKIDGIEYSLIEKKFEDVYFIDLFEDSILQAARAVKKERISYIAALLKNCIKTESKIYSNEKHLFYLLSQIDEVELILLIGYGRIFIKDDPFYKTNKDTIIGPAVTFPCSEELVEDGEFYNSHKRKLASLGLIRPAYKKDKQNMYIIDESTGFYKILRYDITILGKVLLKYLDVEIDA